MRFASCLPDASQTTGCDSSVTNKIIVILLRALIPFKNGGGGICGVNSPSFPLGGLSYDRHSAFSWVTVTSFYKELCRPGQDDRCGWMEEGALPGRRVTSCCWCLWTTTGIKINPGDEIIQHYLL